MSNSVNNLTKFTAQNLPPAADFGIGIAYREDIKAIVECDGVTWSARGKGPIADRPSAALFGVGTWQDAENTYISDGISYKKQTTGNLPTPVWDAAKVKAASGFGNAILAYIGDSTTAGAFAADGTSYAGAAPYSNPSRLAAAMALSGIPTSIGSSFGAHGMTTNANLLSYDTRLTFGASWGKYTSIRSLGGDVIYSTGATLDTYTFAPVAAFDTIDVYYMQNTPGYGTFTIDIGAGVLATVNALGAPTVMKATVTVASGTHVVNITKTVAGAIIIVGISTYKNNNEVQVINLGEAGIRADNYMATGAFAHAAALAVLQPNLSVVGLMINDSRDATPNISLYTSKLQTIVDTCLLYGDVALEIPNPISGAPNFDLYKNAMLNVASSNNLNVIDYNEGFGGSWAAANANGLMGDSLHPKQAGYKLKEIIAFKSGIFN
jgi:hypothetical protein